MRPWQRNGLYEPKGVLVVGTVQIALANAGNSFDLIDGQVRCRHARMAGGGWFMQQRSMTAAPRRGPTKP
jgi:hypothetical protein